MANGAAVMDGVVPTTTPREEISLYQADLRLQQRGLEYQRAVLGEDIHPRSPKAREVAEINSQLRDIATRRDALDRMTQPDIATGVAPEILHFDPKDDGQIVAAFGDIENATHVAVMVPGMTTDLTNVDVTVDRARNLYDALATEPGVRPATVAWFGYDAPDFIGEVRYSDQALEGGPKLREFVNTMNAPDEAHVSLLGHSYGSTVIGVAARGGPIDVDQAVIMGSVGTMGDSTEGMQFPEGTNVYSVTNFGDFAPSVGDLPIIGLHGPVPPEGAIPLPSMGFGHTNYFNDTPAMADIVMGRTDAMAEDHQRRQQTQQQLEQEAMP